MAAKVVGAVIMYIALMIAVYIGFNAYTYTLYGGVYGSSIVGIMLFLFGVFVGWTFAFLLGRFGYRIFSQKVKL